MKNRVHEADKIYFALFNTSAPDIVKQRFEQASTLLQRGFSRREIERYYKVIQNINDLEALEYAARLTGTLPLLSRKMELMVWLVSTLPEMYLVFVNTRDLPLRGKVTIIYAGLHSFFKLIKGLLLLQAKAVKNE